MHPAELSPAELQRECEITRTRRSGPGGQHRNKVETAIVLLHRPTGMTALASERRSQAENLSVAVFRLRVQLAIEVRTRRDSGPSDLWRSRLRGTRIEVHETHADYPVLLAESLDYHEQLDFHLPELAVFLGSSPSQLTKLWKKSPGALNAVNRRRIDRGLRPLE